MATVTVCDKCGKQSPSPDGLYLANNWIEVIVKDRQYTTYDHELIFCRECMQELSYALTGKRSQ